MHRSIFHRGLPIIIASFFLLIFSYGFFLDTQALSVTQRKDTLSRLKVSALSNHTIEFVAPEGVSAGQTVTVTFPVGFSIPLSLDFTDIDVSYGATTGYENELTLAAASAGAVWGASVSGQTFTFTSDTGTIATGSKIIIEIGTQATEGATGDQQITNPSTASIYVVTIAGTFGENGEIAVPVVDEDQTSATSIASPTMVFDLDIGTTSGETNSPYTFNLGALTAGQVMSSGTGSPERPRIIIDLKTSAVGGAVVTIEGANGGIKSSSENHTITTTDSGTPVVLDGTTEGFGACVASVSAVSGTIQGVAPYNGGCTTTSHAVGGITTSPRTIINTADAPAYGTDNNSAQIFLKASITPTTPPANDYAEVVSFVATSTF